MTPRGRARHKASEAGHAWRRAVSGIAAAACSRAHVLMASVRACAVRLCCATCVWAVLCMRPRRGAPCAVRRVVRASVRRSTDADIIFTKAKTAGKRKGPKKINFDEFLHALEMVADQKGIDVADVIGARGLGLACGSRDCCRVVLQGGGTVLLVFGAAACRVVCSTLVAAAARGHTHVGWY